MTNDFSIIQESFRWLVTTRKYKTAKRVVDRIATVNHKENPDICIILAQAEEEVKQQRKATITYSVLDLIKTAQNGEKNHCFVFYLVSSDLRIYATKKSGYKEQQHSLKNKIPLPVTHVDLQWTSLYSKNVTCADDTFLPYDYGTGVVKRYYSIKHMILLRY